MPWFWCTLTAFLGTLHWPCWLVDLGHHGGFVFWEVLSFCEQWTEHRQLCEKAGWPHHRPDRPMSISSVLVTGGNEIRLCCQFVGSLVRALHQLPGGVARCLRCTVNLPPS